MTILDTPTQIERVRVLVLKQALKAIQLGGRLNTAYTPRNVRLAVERMTGRTFKARDYAGMLSALEILAP